jgi:hypothetical protein
MHGFELWKDPTSEEFKEASKEVGKIVVEQVKRIDPRKALKLGMLIYEVIQLYNARTSTSAALFRVIDTIQPEGHPVASVAYAVGGMIDAERAAFVADRARDAKVAMHKIAAPPPTDKELSSKLEELAKLGLEVIVVDRAKEKEQKDVDEGPTLHVV